MYTTLRLNRINRRGLLRASAGLAFGAIGLQLVAACAPSGPASSAGASSSAAGSGGKVQLPTFVAMLNLPSADLPGSADGLIEPGYQTYPANLIKSVRNPPG
jgi:hypothetical protein